VEGSAGEKVRTLQKPFRISDLAKLMAEIVDQTSPSSPQTVTTA
jgi:hypothetical protein